MSNLNILTAPLEGQPRRLISGGKVGLGTNMLPVGLDFLGNNAFSQILAPKALRAAAGVRFNAVNGNGSTFLAPVTAYPTTALVMALWNGEPDGGKSYFMDKVYAFLASGTPDVGGALLACVTRERQTAPTLSTGDNGGYAGTKLGGLSGKAAGASKAVFVTAITALSVPAWFVAGSAPAITATAKIAAGVIEGNLEGGVEIPPGYMLGLTVLAGAGTTPLFGFGAIWDEIQSDNE